MRNLYVGMGLLLFLTSPSHAVILGTGDGQGNTTAPADDPGFANVGILGSGSAVYLGGGWVLTAAHVYNGSGGVPAVTWFQGTSYANLPGSGVQLLNPPGDGYTQYSDLELYQLATAPPLPSLQISSLTPTAGSDVTMIGNGRDRSNTQIGYWTSSWQPSATPSTYAGEIWSNMPDLRWGTNVIDQTSVIEGVGTNTEKAFMTSFSQNGTPYEAQGAPGDSGGGVFYKDPATGAWNLTGIMFSINGLPGQPWGTSVFGDVTYSADLSAYRTQIEQTITIPGDLNHDGIVNSQDLALVVSDWMKTGTGTNDPVGDANHDGIVNTQDIALVSSAMYAGVSVSGSLATVPEPGSWLLAITAATGLYFWRRSTHRGR
ncbi:MAG TPA: dockerin type I domain-containing protein [Pirellulales bacterium]|nr:dockerin type I domain-containing protein [Pirellulales bacterium]